MSAPEPTTWRHPRTGATVTVTTQRIGGWWLTSPADPRFHRLAIEPRRGQQWLQKAGYRPQAA